MSLALKKQSNPPYQREQIRQAIRDWYTREQKELRKIADPIDELQPNRGTVFDLVPVVSSHHAIEVVLDLEDIVGYEIPDSVIKRGGYRSCGEMVNHLDAGVAVLHSKRYPT